MSRTSRLFTLFFVVVLGVSALYVSLPGAPVAQAQACTSSFTITPSATVPNNGAQATVTFTTAALNTPVTVSTTPASLPAGVTVTPLGSQTSGTGTYAVLVSSNAQLSVASSVSVSIAYTEPPNPPGTPCSAGPAQVNFSQAPAIAGNSVISMTNPTPPQADGVQTANIQVLLRDAGLKGVPGRSVTLSVTAGDPTGVTISPTTPQTTGENGILTWTVTSTLPKTLADAITVTANNTTDGFGLPLQVQFFPAPPHHGTAVADPVTALASGDDPVTITVTVLNAGGTAIQGCTVSQSGGPYPGSLDITPAFGTTDSEGKVLFTATSTFAIASQTFQFSVTGGPNCAPPASPLVLTSNAVEFTRAPALPPPGFSSISALPMSVPADNFTTSQITIQLVNQGGNPVVSTPVTLTSDAPVGAVQITGPSQTDPVSGQAVFTVKSSQPGLVTFTTDPIDGFQLSTQVTFTDAPTNKTQSTVVRTPPTGDFAGDGMTPVTVTVTLLNAGSLPVSGHTVTLGSLAPAPGMTIAPQSAGSDTTNAEGKAFFTVTAVTPATPLSVTLQATDTTQPLVLDDPADTISINFTVPPASAARSTVVVAGEAPPNPLGVLANGVATATINVTVLDQFTPGHPLPGKMVRLDPDPATGVVCTPACGVPTAANGSGVASFVVKSTSAALVTFTATVTSDTPNVIIADTGLVNFTTPPATVARIAVTPPGNLPANGQLDGEATITVELDDAGGNPAVGKVLFLDAAGAPNEGAIIYATSATQSTTLVNGEATAVWRVRSSVGQAVTFTIRNQTDGGDAGTALVTWVASANPVVGANSSIAVSPTTAAADNTETVTITAILRDATNTVVQGKNAQLIVTPGLPTGATLLPAVESGPSNSSGEVTWTLRSPTAGTATFTATVSSDGAFISNVTPGGSNSVTFNPVGSDVSATLSTAAVTGSPALANGTQAITVTVTLKNAAGTPLPGLGVALQSSRAGQDTITPASVDTDVNGEAVFTVTSSTVGTATLTVLGDTGSSGGAVTLSAHPTIRFNPVSSLVDAFNSTIDVGGAAPADGSSTITVVVTLLDSAGDPVTTAQNVVLSSSRGAADIILPAFDSSDPITGVAEFTIRSTQAGSGTLTAVAGGTELASHPQFNFNPLVSPVDPSTSDVVVNMPDAPADGSTPITVTVTVRNSVPTPLNGILVTLSTQPPVTVQATQGTTNSSGIATFELTSIAAHPTVTITAIADGVQLDDQRTVGFTALPVNADQSTISASPLSVAANGVAASTVTVTARDVNGNPVAGVVAAVTSDRGATDFIAPVGSNLTGSNGTAQFTVRSNTVGNAVLSASANGVNITGTVTVGFTSGVAVSPTLSTIVVTAPGTAPADGTSPIEVQVTVKDAAGNNLASRAVTLNSTPGGVTFNPTTALSNASGVATFNITSATPGARTIGASVDGVTLIPTSPPSVTTATFTTVAAVSPTLSDIAASPASAPANGTSAITITVTARDTGGTALAGRVVTIASSRGGTDTIAPQSAGSNTTNGAGQATFTVTSSTVGSPVISATAGGVALDPSKNITIGFASTAAVSPTLSTVDATNSPQPAGGTPIQVVVHVVDGSNVALVGKSVTLTVSPNTGITISPNGGTTATDGSGNATFQVSSPNAGIFTASAVEGVAPNQVTLIDTAQITFQAPLGPPDLAITKSGQATFNAGVASPFIIAVNNIGSGPTTGTITVTDNLPVGMRFWGTLGDTQGFSCGAAGQQVTCTRGTALAQGGVASFQLLANPDPAFFTTAQNLSNTASVSVPGDTNTGNNTSGALFFNVTPINLNQIFEGNSTVSVNPATVPADNTSVATITITLRNIQNQGVAGATVTLTPSVATGITVASATPTTDGNGNISFTAKSSVNQTVTFTIIATSSAGSVTFANHPQVVFGSGGTGGTGGTGTTGVTSPTTSTVLADCSAIPANNVAQAIVQVTLKDAAGNPLAGRAVTLTANPAPATLLLTPVSGTTTAADGTVRWTVRSSAQGSSIFTASTTDGSLIFINQTATVTFGAPNSTSTCTGLPTTTTGTAIAAVDQNLLIVPTGPITGRVVAWRLRVRTGPGLDYQILGLLRLGTEVSIVARNSRTTWYMIQLEEGTAWVSAWWIRVTRTSVRRLPVVDDQPGTAPIVPVPSQLIPLVGEGIGRINTYLLRVRVGPGLEYQQIGLLREGTEVLLLGISPNRAWYKIRTDDGDRWVSAFYVRVIRINGARLPVVEPEPRP